MLNVIKSKLTKNISTKVIQQKTQSLITFEIPSLDSTLNTLLESPLLGEGIFSFELFTDENGTIQSLVAPPYMRKHFKNETIRHFNWENDVKCYEIYMKKPPFLPLFTKSQINLINDLQLLVSKDTQMYTQLLLKKRSKQYLDHMISLYGEYLRGIDNPLESEKGRRKQQKLIKFVDKVSGINSERLPVEEIEDKVTDICFQFELRLLINGRSDADEIENLLHELDFFNELGLHEVKNKDEFISLVDNRQFSEDGRYQTIGISELKNVIGGEVVERDSDVEIAHKLISGKTGKWKTVAPIHLLPIGEKKEREIDQHLVDELPNALVTAKAIKNPNVDVVDVELGATVQRITMKIPQQIVFTDIKNKLSNIKTALGAELSIIQGNEPNTVTFLIPCSQREILYLKEILQDEEFIKFAEDNPLPFFCGIDMFNKPQFKCLTKAPHLLVAGATNSGKSVFLNAMLITLILLKSPQELRLIMIDPKQVELTQYDGYKHVESLITDMDEAVPTLDKLVEEMEKRYSQFAKAKVKNISGYNNSSKQKIPYIVCVIEEYADLKMVHPDVEEYVERLGQKARASGIHLILVTQRPDKNVISGVIKSNFPSRISFSLSSSSEYMTVFGSGIGHKLIGFGDGVVSYVGQTENFIRFQAPVITLDEKEEELTFDNIRKFYKGEVVEGLELGEVEKEEVIEEEPLDRLKRVIATSGDCRIKELQKEMKIRINAVQDLMHQLVEEGWLEKNERGQYVLITDEEELSKWRSH
jgi:S-DNA-T family DNA segregation ATPase FtsK/SpoIIIE